MQQTESSRCSGCAVAEQRTKAIHLLVDLFLARIQDHGDHGPDCCRSIECDQRSPAEPCDQCGNEECPECDCGRAEWDADVAKLRSDLAEIMADTPDRALPGGTGGGSTPAAEPRLSDREAHAKPTETAPAFSDPCRCGHSGMVYHATVRSTWGPCLFAGCACAYFARSP